ncbi:SRPBCC domain-containing protein [Thalassospira xianhensis]|uniref:SRPBCC family protein n=1 Tax=Thalassospira xianhensis TaxID=478503 RepID=UPI001ABFF948|nr:hypothetical protein [Thalassospira xianhensis]
MTDSKTRTAKPAKPTASRHLEFEFRLDAPKEKVWRAISIPEIRESWLPGTNLRNAKPIRQIPGEEVTYQMRDPSPPYLESVVTFHLAQTGENSTCLRIIHQLTDARCLTPAKAANSNSAEIMCAA